jgi:predicted short-subunit dehydrogenase-like oxidoreductase (DUF2520 family)
MALPEIDIIGTGNLATVLAPNLEQSGFVVNNVYGRNLASANQLAGRLYQASPTDNLDFSSSKSNVFLIAISDSAIEEVSRELVLPDEAIVAHTSGSNPLSILGYTASNNIGVFYPVQTFSKNRKLSFKDVPILIEGENKFTRKTLSSIAGKLTSNVQEASSKQRMLIHLAAVFASNFTNSMLIHASEIMKAAKLDFDLLAPVVAETMEKSFDLGPINAQTGPAKRGDMEIIEKHLDILEETPDKEEMYRLITQQILDRSNAE